MGHSADVRGESLIFQDFNNCFVIFSSSGRIAFSRMRLKPMGVYVAPTRLKEHQGNEKPFPGSWLQLSAKNPEKTLSVSVTTRALDSSFQYISEWFLCREGQ